MHLAKANYICEFYVTYLVSACGQTRYDIWDETLRARQGSITANTADFEDFVEHVLERRPTRTPEEIRRAVMDFVNYSMMGFGMFRVVASSGRHGWNYHSERSGGWRDNLVCNCLCSALLISLLHQRRGHYDEPVHRVCECGAETAQSKRSSQASLVDFKFHHLDARPMNQVMRQFPQCITMSHSIKNNGECLYSFLIYPLQWMLSNEAEHNARSKSTRRAVVVANLTSLLNDVYTICSAEYERKFHEVWKYDENLSWAR
jgi:hypothetical protein